MILIVNLCKDPLHYDEFVAPIVRIVADAGHGYSVVDFGDDVNFEDFEKIIICGTALADDAYLEYDVSFLRDVSQPIFGICAGMQLLALHAGAELSKLQEIGMKKFEIVKAHPFFDDVDEGYCLHKHAVSNVEGYDVVLKTSCVQAIVHDELKRYGCLFHPEVRNEQMLLRFLDKDFN